MNEQRILHAIVDPLCGWCYAAAPLLEAAKAHFSIQLHGGGLFIGARSRVVSAELRELILSHVGRIQQASGQRFGADFTDSLLCKEGLVLDSAPPIAAMMAAQTLDDYAVQMFHAMQVAYYRHGEHLSDAANLARIAAEQGIDKSKFELAFAAATLQVDAHISSSRKLLVQAGSKTFPTFLVEIAPDNLLRLDHQAYYGRVVDWQAYLQTV